MGSATRLQGTLNADGSIRSAALNPGGRGSGVRLPPGEMLPLLLPWGGVPSPCTPLHIGAHGLSELRAPAETALNPVMLKVTARPSRCPI